MARKLLINGKIYEATGSRKVALNGVIYEETAAASNFVQTWNNGSSWATSTTVTVSGSTSGYLLVGSVSLKSKNVTPTATGWTLRENYAGTVTTGAVFERIATGDANDNFIPTWIGNCSCRAAVVEFSGLSATPYETSGEDITYVTTEQSAGSAINSGSTTPSTANGIAIAVYMGPDESDIVNSLSIDNGYTLDASVGSGVYPSIGFAHKNYTTTAAQSPNWSGVPANAWNGYGVILAYKEAAAGGLTPVSNNSTLQWNLIQAIQNNSQIQWDLLNVISNNSQLQWNLLGEISNNSQLQWSLIEAVSNNSDLRWNLESSLTPISNNSTLQWSLLELVSNNSTLQWDLDSALAAISNTIDLRWSLQSAVSNLLTANWDLLESVGVDSDLRWDLTTAITNSLESQWDLLSDVSGDLQIQWDSIATVDGSIELRWTLLSDNVTLTTTNILMLRAKTKSFSLRVKNKTLTLR